MNSNLILLSKLLHKAVCYLLYMSSICPTDRRIYFCKHYIIFHGEKYRQPNQFDS